MVGDVVGEAVGGGSSVGDADAVTVGDALGVVLGRVVVGLFDGENDGATVGAGEEGVDGAPVGRAGNESSTLVIPLVSSEQNIRFNKNGRLLSASSMLT